MKYLLILCLTFMAAFYGGYVFMIITNDSTGVSDDEDEEQKKFLDRWDEKRGNR